MSVLYYPEERKQLQVGLFPAHVIDPGVGKKFNGGIPHNTVFRIAPEAVEYENEQPDGEVVSGEDMVGEEVRHEGFWLNESPEKVGDNWRFQVTAKAMGMEFETKKVKTPKGTEVDAELLVPLDDTVKGNPVLVQIEERVRRSDYKKPKEEQRTIRVVTRVLPWEKGEKLDLLEELFKDDDTEQEY